MGAIVRTAAARGLASSAALAGAVAGSLAASAAILHWQGADAPNHLFRIDLFRRAGFTVWNTAWYGGHHTPGYSVLLPPLGAAMGPAALGVAAAVVAAASFDRLLRAVPGANARRCRLGSLVFAAGTVANLAVGRLAFALGLALGLSALAAGCWGVLAGPPRTARRPARTPTVGTALLSFGAALASPVAGAFLALAWAASAIGRRSTRDALLAACAAAPVIVLSMAFPEGGTFPFRWSALVLTLTACVATGLALGPAPRTLPVGLVLYAGAAVATFVVPNPLGANVTRLGMFVLAPVVVALAPWRRWLVPLCVGLLWWQWSPALDGALRSGRDPSTRAEYYAPLLEFLARRPTPVGRVEVVFTERHFEAAFVAPTVPIARGWERQVDVRANPLFYDHRGLDVAAYGGWLRANGVDYVALADAPLDPSAIAEAAVVEAGPAYLQPAWQGGHWRVWRVLDGAGLVAGPARLVAQTPDTVTLDAWASGTVTLRVRWTALWSVTGPACVAPGPEGWVRLDVRGPGRLVLHPVLLGRRAHCPP